MPTDDSRAAGEHPAPAPMDAPSSPSETRTAPRTNDAAHRASQAPHAPQGRREVPLAPTPSRWPWPTQDPLAPPRDLSGGLAGYTHKLSRYLAPVFAAYCLIATLQEVTGALFPEAIGSAIDALTGTGFSAQFGRSILLILALLAVNITAIGIGEILESNLWDRASQESVRSAGRRLSLRGRLIKRRLAAGDVVTSLGDDALVVGSLAAWLPSLVASAIGLVVVSTLMLRTSLALGLVVLIGVPAALSLSLAIAPRLETLQGGVREAEGRLSTITTDAVAGLRILRGVGGEARFVANYRQRSAEVRDSAIRLAKTSSALMAISETAPLLLTGVVIIAGARLVHTGELSVGGLVAFYGFMNYVGSPMRVVLRSLENFIKARVAARKIVSVIDAGDEAEAARPTGASARTVDWDADLVDDPSGLIVRAGLLTGIVASSVEAASELAARLGALDGAEGTSIGRTPLASIDPAESRRHIILVAAVQHLFEGTLRSAVLGADGLTAPAREHAELIRNDVLDPTSSGTVLVDADTSRDEEILAALDAADAKDVLTSLPGGLDGILTEKGRNLSGGQRQRLALARALLARPEVLILVDPTSALDAHTEARIARRLHEARRGSTTLVFTSSPLLLDQCDEVIALGADGRVVGRREDA